MQPWKTVERKTILSHSKWLTVEEHTVLLPDGRQIPRWPWLILPDYANVVAVTTEGEFICFRQTKYSVEGTTLAPIGGYLEPREDPLQAARRELLEETGYEAAEWIHLGTHAVDGNHGAGTAHLFLARGARKVAQPRSDDLEEQQMILLKRADIVAALLKGEFKVLSWATAMAVALLHIPEGGPNDRR